MNNETQQITLATLPTATAQQVFDQASRHLLTQGKKSTTHPAGGACLYRNPEGLSCAAGCFMSQEEYDALAVRPRQCGSITRLGPEGATWDSLADRGWVPSAHARLIDSLQCVHDGADPSAWRGRLRDLARTYTLSPAVLDEFPERLTGLRASAVILDEFSESLHGALKDLVIHGHAVVPA